jgi:hypothetical protein
MTQFMEELMWQNSFASLRPEDFVLNSDKKNCLQGVKGTGLIH